MPAFTLIPCAIEPKTRFQRVRYPKCSPTPKSGLAKTLSDVKSATYKMQCEISGLVRRVARRCSPDTPPDDRGGRCHAPLQSRADCDRIAEPPRSPAGGCLVAAVDWMLSDASAFSLHVPARAGFQPACRS